jgi:hypothetical protein
MEATSYRYIVDKMYVQIDRQGCSSLMKKEEGGDCVLLLYLFSITHLQTREYSCHDTKPR